MPPAFVAGDAHTIMRIGRERSVESHDARARLGSPGALREAFSPFSRETLFPANGKPLKKINVLILREVRDG